MFKSNLFIKSMFIITIVMIGYDFGMSIFSIPKIEESIYSLEEKNAKTLMSKIVSISNNVHTDLLLFKDAAISIHKKNLKDINSIAYSLLEKNYIKFKNGEFNEEEAKKSAYTEISKLKYGKYGHFFIFDANYDIVAHADKNIMGKNIFNIQDKNGNYFVKGLLDDTKDIYGPKLLESLLKR